MESAVRVYSSSDLKSQVKFAEGTVSTIYSAFLHGLKVAVKTLKPVSELDEGQAHDRVQKDFENELLINMYLRHPNIVLLIGCVRTNMLKSLVFEYSEDGQLKCSRFGLSHLNEGIDACMGIARALCFAHGLGIVHRDVKPSQVIMFNGVAKVGDWGLASLSQEGGCKSGETGTWEFMAPEVIRSERYNCQADVYSFGVLLYCVIMGVEYPYQDRYLTPCQAAVGVAKRELRPKLSCKIPESALNVITSCWKGDAEARPNMGEVIMMLNSVRTSLTKESSSSPSEGLYAWLWGS